MKGREVPELCEGGEMAFPLLDKNKLLDIEQDMAQISPHLLFSPACGGRGASHELQRVFHFFCCSRATESVFIEPGDALLVGSVCLLFQ